MEEETVSHILWECGSAWDVWGGNSRKLQKAAFRGREFIRIFEEMAANSDIKELEIFSVIARRIWLRRNLVVHEDSFLHPNQVVRESVTSLEEYWNANDRVTEATDQQATLTTIPWQLPPTMMLKINWDAAMGEKCGRIGLGVIARDCWGRVLIARSMTKMLDVHLATAAALAAVKELGANGLIIEGDAKKVVQAVNSHLPCNSSYRHLMEDIQAGMEAFSNSSFNFIPRYGNFAAHGLAKAEPGF